MTDNQYFYVRPADVDTAGCFLILCDEEAHHCVNVLRKNAGDECFAVDGTGREFVIRIQSHKPKEVRCDILSSSLRSRELPYELILAAALIRPDPYEWMLEKCTELGVSEFIPVMTSRSHAEPGINRVARWKKILLTAMKQSRRSVLPGLTHCTAFNSLVHLSGEYDQCVIFHESAVESLAGYLNHYPIAPEKRILAVIGPEGGFTDSEIAAAREAGWPVLSLGARRLRSETAAICACSIFSNHQSLP